MVKSNELHQIKMIKLIKNKIINIVKPIRNNSELQMQNANMRKMDELERKLINNQNYIHIYYKFSNYQEYIVAKYFIEQATIPFHTKLLFNVYSVSYSIKNSNYVNLIEEPFSTLNEYVAFFDSELPQEVEKHPHSNFQYDDQLYEVVISEDVIFGDMDYFLELTKELQVILLMENELNVNYREEGVALNLSQYLEKNITIYNNELNKLKMLDELRINTQYSGEIAEEIVGQLLEIDKTMNIYKFDEQKYFPEFNEYNKEFMEQKIEVCICLAVNKFINNVRKITISNGVKINLKECIDPKVENRILYNEYYIYAETKYLSKNSTMKEVLIEKKIQDKIFLDEHEFSYYQTYQSKNTNGTPNTIRIDVNYQTYDKKIINEFKEFEIQFSSRYSSNSLMFNVIHYQEENELELIVTFGSEYISKDEVSEIFDDFIFYFHNFDGDADLYTFYNIDDEIIIEHDHQIKMFIDDNDEFIERAKELEIEDIMNQEEKRVDELAGSIKLQNKELKENENQRNKEERQLEEAKEPPKRNNFLESIKEFLFGINKIEVQASLNAESKILFDEAEMDKIVENASIFKSSGELLKAEDAEIIYNVEMNESSAFENNNEKLGGIKLNNSSTIAFQNAYEQYNEEHNSSNINNPKIEELLEERDFAEDV